MSVTFRSGDLQGPNVHVGYASLMCEALGLPTDPWGRVDIHTLRQGLLKALNTIPKGIPAQEGERFTVGAQTTEGIETRLRELAYFVEIAVAQGRTFVEWD